MITTIRLQHFRSYKDDSFEFDPNVNIVIGPNASGKTNLLEAVLVLARGRSYKAKDAELIQFNAPWARVDGFFGQQNRSVKLKPENGKIIKGFLIDEKPYKRLALERTVPSVFFEPNHLQIVIRGPDQRREYIDELLEQSVPGFKTLSASYRRALAQRNALLKYSANQATKQMFAWNVRLSELGGKIASARQELVTDINKKISSIYSQIADHRSKVLLEYNSHFPADQYSSELLSKLEKNTTLDLERGYTVYGPHREDVSFYLNKKLVNHTASRGETRSLLLSMKVYELGLIEKSRGQKPILLLDDVFSELDGKRRRSLVEHLKNHQTIITTTDADAVLEYFSGKHNLVPLG